jgi:hypothetical protein
MERPKFIANEDIISRDGKTFFFEVQNMWDDGTYPSFTASQAYELGNYLTYLNFDRNREKFEEASPKGRYLWRVLIGLDQFFNAVLGGNPDETISSRSHKAALRGKWWGKVLCHALHKIDYDHCRKSVEWDE